jgi:hypothetical protein
MAVTSIDPVPATLPAWARKPTSASITMDTVHSAGPWYFDPTPDDNAEFAETRTRFRAYGGPSGTMDFYTAVLKQIGHAVGFATQAGAPLAIEGRLTPAPTAGSDISVIFTFADGTTTRLETMPGSRLRLPYPSSSDEGDLMGEPPCVLPCGGNRYLISDLDARILRDGYGYTVSLPSTRETFLANFNTTTGALAVNGEPGVNDVITIDAAGADLRVNVNGVVARFAASSVTAIDVRSGGGADTINVEYLPAGLAAATVDAGAENDVINLAPVGGFLDALASALSVAGGDGSDQLNVNDRNDGYGDSYTVEATGVSRPYFGGVSAGGDVEGVALSAGNAANAITVRGTAAGVRTAVDAGGGDDAITVGDGTLGGDLLGPLVIDGGVGSDRLTIDDHSASAGIDWTVGSSTLRRADSASVNYGGAEVLVLTVGTGNDVVRVKGTPAGVVTYLANSGGSDLFAVGDGTGGLGDLFGTVFVLGRGSDRAVVTGTAADTTYTLSGTYVYLASRPGIRVGSSGVNRLELRAGAGSDTVNVTATVAGVTTVVATGGGNDTVNVGSVPDPAPYGTVVGDRLETVRGPLTVDGEGDADTLVLRDQGSGIGSTYLLGGSTVLVSSLPGFALTYWGVENLGLNTSAADDTIVLFGTGLPFYVGLDAGAGNDVLRGTDADTNWAVTGANSGAVGSVSFRGVESLTGGSGRDTFYFYPGGSVAGVIDGADGSDALNYSLYGGPWSADLLWGWATGTGGVRNVEAAVG